MRLRDKLARLGSASRVQRKDATTVHAELEPASAAALEPQPAFSPEPVLSAEAPRASEPASAEDAARTERIAKLRALIGEVRARPVRTPGASEPREDARDEHAVPHRHSGVREMLPIGELRQTEHGPMHVVEQWLSPEHCHGRVAVRRALSVDSALTAKLALDPALESVDLRRMLILDTETTGLAGGTGTVPFLIGLAFFDEGSLKVEQLFLRELGGERPLLAHLARRVAEASCIVSYNGKSFDWPLVRTRAILSRVALPEPAAHLDLLHCARRILKPRMESVRLCEVEQALLGHYREDDVHGSLIPALYLDYLRGGSAQALVPVLEHNASDMIGLAALLPRLVEHFAEVRAEDDPGEHLAYARVALRARDLSRAEAFARAAAQGGGARDLTRQAHEVVAAAARKDGDTHKAVEALHEALDAASEPLHLAQLHHTLAKLYEHSLKDAASAHRHARHTALAEGEQAHGRRLGRLRKRLLGPIV